MKQCFENRIAIKAETRDHGHSKSDVRLAIDYENGHSKTDGGSESHVPLGKFARRTASLDASYVKKTLFLMVKTKIIAREEKRSIVESY